MPDSGGLRFSYFTTMDNRENRLPYRNLLDNVAEQARLCEDAGFSTLWTGEHHFGHEGFDIHPNPCITATHLATKTSTLRLGFLALIATEWHPLRLAEDVALVDQLSDGRVECGLGRGLAVREFTNLNPLADRRNDRRNRALFAETVDVIKKAWTTDPFTYDGVFFQFPQRGVKDHTAAWYKPDTRYRSEQGDYVGMRIVPRPLQDPHPPLWGVSDTIGGFEDAADLGLRPVTWLPSTGGIVDAFRAYQARASMLAGHQLDLGEQCGLLRTCFVAPTMEVARRITEESVNFLYGQYIAGYRGRQIFADRGETLSAEQLSSDWFDFLMERDHLLIGSPDDVAERIIKLWEATRMQDLLTLMWLPGVAHEDMMSSIDLFGRSVIPQVQSHLRGMADTGSS